MHAAHLVTDRGGSIMATPLHDTPTKDSTPKSVEVL